MRNRVRGMFLFGLCFWITGQLSAEKVVRVKSEIDWPAFIQRQDMVWKTLPEYWYECVFSRLFLMPGQTLLSGI